MIIYFSVSLSHRRSSQFLSKLNPPSFDSMDSVTIHWKEVEQYFTVVVLFGFQFYPVYNFGKFINFGLGTVRSDRVKICPKQLTNSLNHNYLFGPISS